MEDIRRLATIHFEKEEVIFYPSLRPALPELLAQMDQQHEEVREVEHHVVALLSDPPANPDSRWMNELRLLGTELHDLIQHHIVAEEDDLFRLAESRLSAEDQKRLAAEMTDVHNQRSGL
jgi:hemerythrin-like domain-containing protein